MFDEFEETLFSHWCALYVQIVVRNRQRLAQLLTQCSQKNMERLLDATPHLTEPPPSDPVDNDALLQSYGVLRELEQRYRLSFFRPLKPGIPEVRHNDIRYLLCPISDGPLLRAVPPQNRFEPDRGLGVDGVIQLDYHWRSVEDGASFDFQASNAFDCFADGCRQHLKIGLSPVAQCADMRWNCDTNDSRGSSGEIPFWCVGAHDETALHDRIMVVLQQAHDQGVDLLLFPELTMTPDLESAIANWLQTHNLWQPALRLVVAGTRHVFHASDVGNDYSNRCTVFGHDGAVEWVQEKRQPFRLDAGAAQNLLGQACPGATEPTRLSNAFAMRHTALGTLAAPICLDFIHDSVWPLLPVHLYLVPAMSEGLSRFEQRCKNVGGKGAAAFVCNAHDKNTHVSYIPSKQTPACKKTGEHLFIVTIDAKVN